jgi:hypothetical protein
MEIQKHYAEVATSPDHEFHFHTGREAARQVGYDDAIIDELPDEVIASFAGVAIRFTSDCHAWERPSSTSDREPESTP